jgi:hypothetical protein
VYSFLLSLYKLDASTLAGELVLGSLRRLEFQSVLAGFGNWFQELLHAYLWILVSTAATSYVGLQRFCRISRQSSPVAYTFGWNIWLINLTAGGLLGYCSSKCITKRKVPSSNGVSAGPIITAFLYQISLWGLWVFTGSIYQVITLSATGEAETPAGGSVCIRWAACQYYFTSPQSFCCHQPWNLS